MIYGKMKVTKMCPVCQKTFVSQTAAKRKFCSYSCSVKKRIGVKGLVTYTPELRKKLSLAKKGKTGSLSNGWRGGVSFEKYTIDWNNTLKQSIRERDMYLCQICHQKQGDRAHQVHHIDYDKKNCNPDNLITLCMSCHFKTNGKREYWLDFFNRFNKN